MSFVSLVVPKQNTSSSNYGPIRNSRSRLRERVLRCGSELSESQQRLNQASRFPGIPFHYLTISTGQSGRITAVFSNAISPRNPEVELADELEMSVLNISKIRALLPKIANKEFVTNCYLKLLSPNASPSINTAPRLVEAFLECGGMSEETKKSFFASPINLKKIDQKFLVDLFLSLKTPPNSYAFIYSMGSYRLEEVFVACLSHKLSSSLQGLFNKYGSVEFSKLLKRNITDWTFTAATVKLLTPYSHLVREVNESIFSYYIQLFRSDSSLEALASSKGFLFRAEVFDYLTGENQNPSIEHLLVAFHVYWSLQQESSDELFDTAITVAEAIYTKDPESINNYILNLLKSTPPQSCFSSLLIEILPLLSAETIQVICEKLKQLTSEPVLDTSSVEFIQELKEGSLHIWSTDYAPNVRNYTVLAKGTQIGKDGEFDMDKTLDIMKTLRSKSPNTVEFDYGRIQAYLSGGVCSAMTLRLLSLFREAIKSSASSISEALKKAATAVKIAGPEYRAIQSAYNTIGKTEINSGDFKRDKIQALLNYDNSDLAISLASSEIDLSASDSLSKLRDEINSLPDGTYVTRSLNPFQSSTPNSQPTPSSIKQENYGHSTLLIKDQGIGYYYDPAIGVLQLNSPEQLHMILQWQNTRWRLPLTRFYQVAENSRNSPVSVAALSPVASSATRFFAAS